MDQARDSYDSSRVSISKRRARRSKSGRWLGSLASGRVVRAESWRENREELGQLIGSELLHQFFPEFVPEFRRGHKSFPSPGAAAAVIPGGSANGLIEWKTKGGRVFRDLDE
jgi:hypothetical protein